MAADSVFLAFNLALVGLYFWSAIISSIIYVCLMMLLKYVLSHLGIPVDKGFKVEDDEDGMFYCIIIFICLLLFILGVIAFIYDSKFWAIAMLAVSLVTSVTCPLPVRRRDGKGRPEIALGILIAFALFAMFVHSWQTMVAVFLTIGILMLFGKLIPARP